MKSTGTTSKDIKKLTAPVDLETVSDIIKRYLGGHI
jgi:hypothetical protein